MTPLPPYFHPTAPKRRGPGPAPPRMAEPRPLFDDTSGGSAPGRAYGAAPPPPPNPSAAAAAAFLAEPVSTIAAAYGSSWASQGREMMDRNVSGAGGLSVGLWVREGGSGAVCGAGGCQWGPRVGLEDPKTALLAPKSRTERICQAPNPPFFVPKPRAAITSQTPAPHFLP